MENASIIYLVLCAGPTGLEIRNPDHHQTRFDAMNLMAASESRNEFSLEITFLEVSLIVSICMNL